MITLEIDDQVVTNFTSLSISKSMQSIANAFNITFEGEIPKITADSEITIKKDDDILIVGFIEKPVKTDSGALTCTVAGRSKSGVLIGGSIEGLSEFTKQKVDYIIKQITANYDVDVAFIGDMGKPIDKFSIEPSEDPYSAIVRLLQLRNLIAFDIKGVLTVRKSSDISYSSTIDNTNFVIISSEDYSNLFSSYTVIGNGEKDKISYTADNYLLTKHRPKTIIADTKVDKLTVQKMAEWELQKAIGMSQKISATGYSWTTPEGELWDINSLVPVSSEKLEIEENMLIASINYTYNNSGESIDLQLVKEGTFA